MARAGLWFTIIGLSAAGLLTGCVDGGGNSADGGGAIFATAPGGKKSGTRDVEAPEVFQATEKALWDGRPSLGGIWVAAPSVTNPERVQIVNQATGKTVTGALFRREREIPGPRLQLSSDAAEALGILAGQPTEIRVIALRKEEVKAAVAPVAPVAPVDEAAKPGETKPADAKPGEAAAIASAALAAVESGKPAPAASSGASAASGAPAASADAAAVAGAAVVAADEPPKRKTGKERRAEARAEREAKKRAAAEAKAAASAAEADAALTAGDAAATAAAPTAATAAVTPIEAVPLDARKPEVVAAKPETAGKRKVVGADAAPAAKPSASAAPAAVAPVVASGPVRPIQVASFSKEDNARRAAEALAKIGITATPQKTEKGEQSVWGVVVQGDEAVLKKIKAAGFADAYFLK